MDGFQKAFIVIVGIAVLITVGLYLGFIPDGSVPETTIVGPIVYKPLPPINGAQPTTMFYTVKDYYLLERVFTDPLYTWEYVVFDSLEGFGEGDAVVVKGIVEDRACDYGTFKAIRILTIKHFEGPVPE